MSTYTPIASQTLGSTATSVTFSSIPQGYTDLIIVINSGSTASGQDIRCRFNGDSGSNYSFTFLTGNGSAASSGRATSQTFMPLDYNGYLSGSIATTTIINCMNYSNSTTYKTILGRFNTAAFGTDAAVGLWRSIVAITSIEFLTSASTFLAGSTFSIYGIQVGDKAQKAQGGNVVTSDGTYIYHTFTSSGAFIPNQALTADYLVVAGGGGGGSQFGGGGGAGGMRCTVGGTGGSGSLESPLSLSSGKSYPVIVGAGGASAGSAYSLEAQGNNGSNSVFSTITSTGGGGGGGANAVGSAGGSGGGGDGRDFAGGAASPANQGFAGGNGVIQGGTAGGGGGGGASAAGQTSQPTRSGDGGNGRATSISGSSVTYAGGGSGGAGGLQVGQGTAGTGGGGLGGYLTTNPTSGTVNTGGGGGGGQQANQTITGSAGGSGIVIIRYLA